MRSFLKVFGPVAAIFLLASQAEALTYNVAFKGFNSNALDNDTGSVLSALTPSQLGSVEITGTITTDGTLGPLTAANILAWEFTIRDFNSVETHNSAGLAGAVTLEGAEFLEATPSKLLSVLPSLAAGPFTRFGNNVFVPNGTSFFQISSQTLLTFQAFVPDGSAPSGFSGTFVNKTLPVGPGGKAVLAAVPLPATGALGAMGLAALAFVGRRRKSAA